jgi:hypothetical protein
MAADPILAELISSDLRQAAIRAMRKAADFYRGEVASYNGYVYYYSLDLQQRWGEGKAAPYTLFVQPPGTPTVGKAYLKAYAATGDGFHLDAARETAGALVLGQLESGGWKQPARFDAIEAAYRDALSGAGSPPAPSAKELEEDVRKIIQELDADGRWITTYAGERLVGQPEFKDSFRYISSAVFSRNVEILSQCIAPSRRQ